jgi:DNA-binding CsgD family transcriptional regulator
MKALDRTEYHFAYFAYDAQDQTLKVRGGVWRDTEGSPLDSCTADPALRFRLSDESSLVARASNSAEPLYVADCRSGEHWIDGYRVSSVYLVPVGGESPCDVVALLSHELDGFEEGERALASALVGYLARVQSGSGADVRVRHLEAGLRRLSAEISALGVGASERGGAYPSGLLERLRLVSPREWEVLDRLRTGLRVSTISRELEISANTVRNHLKSIYRKLGVSSQAELLERLRGTSLRPAAEPLRSVDDAA